MRPGKKEAHESHYTNSPLCKRLIALAPDHCDLYNQNVKDFYTRGYKYADGKKGQYI
jgi:hypothetical protein